MHVCGADTSIRTTVYESPCPPPHLPCHSFVLSTEESEKYPSARTTFECDIEMMYLKGVKDRLLNLIIRIEKYHCEV